MTYEFHPEASQEFLDAIKHYEACESGLGYDFFVEVHSGVDHILAHPKAWPVLDGDIRRFLTNRFPYGILYSIETDRIFILAVMHLHREPGYWKHRN